MVLRPSVQSGKYAPTHRSAGVSSRVGNDTPSGGGVAQHLVRECATISGLAGGVAQHLVLRCATKAGEYGARSRVPGAAGGRGAGEGDFGVVILENYRFSLKLPILERLNSGNFTS